MNDNKASRQSKVLKCSSNAAPQKQKESSEEHNKQYDPTSSHLSQALIDRHRSQRIIQPFTMQSCDLSPFYIGSETVQLGVRSLI